MLAVWLQASGQDNLETDFRSHCARLCQHLIAELERDVFWRQQVNWYSEYFLQLDLQATKVEQRCTGQRIHQQVKISLPSRSLPCSTEPKTRGLAARKRVAASRTALRFWSMVKDGFMRISENFKEMMACRRGNCNNNADLDSSECDLK